LRPLYSASTRSIFEHNAGKPEVLDDCEDFEKSYRHPFQYEKPAADGIFYPWDTKLLPDINDLWVETAEGPPISPVSPCGVLGTAPIGSGEPQKLP
jgi:hypothetical protein